MINDDIQKQEVGNNSNAYQANGNITVVNQYTLAEEQAYKICKEIVENNIIKFSGDAIETAIQEFKEFADLYVEKITKQEEDVVEKIINRFKEPNMQYAIFEAQKGYAKYGDEEKAEKLVQLLIEKGKQKTGSQKDILIDDAIEKISKITNNQLNILSYLVSNTIIFHTVNLQQMKTFFLDRILKFYNAIDLKTFNSDIQYLMQIGCIRQFSIAQIGNKLINQIKELYGGYFSAGFTRQDFESEYGTVNDNIIVPCLTNNELWQTNFVSKNDIEQLKTDLKINENQYNILNKFYNKLITDAKIKETLLQLEPNIGELLNDNSQIHNIELMPLGKLIGIKNYEVVLKTNIQWEI